MSDVNFIYVHCAVVDGMLGVIVCVSLSVFRSEIEEGNTRCLLACPTQFTSNSQFSKFVLKNNISVVIGIHAYKSGRFMKGKPTSLLYFSRLLLLPTYLVYDLSNFSRLLISPTVLAYFSRLLLLPTYLAYYLSNFSRLLISPPSLLYFPRLLLLPTYLVYYLSNISRLLISPTVLTYLYRLFLLPTYLVYYLSNFSPLLISPTVLAYFVGLLRTLFLQQRYCFLFFLARPTIKTST